MRTFVIAALVTLTAAPATAHEEAVERPTVQVSASGWVDRAPEVARVVLAVETTEKTAQKATEANAARMNRVMRALRHAGVGKEFVRTVGFNVSPRYSPESRRRNIEPDGYTHS